MKHPYHTMLPKYLQDLLRDAAATEREDLISSTVREVQASLSQRFHNNDTVALRTFHHEPRMLVPNAGFVVGYAGTASRK